MPRRTPYAPFDTSFDDIKPFASAAKHLAFHADYEKLRFRYHLLGMLQAEFDEDIRVHFWHPDLVEITPDDPRSVHDHRFDLVSAVVVGRILDEPVEVLPKEHGYGPGEGWKESSLWALDHAKVQADVGDTRSVKLGDVHYREEQRALRQAGAVYRIEKRSFHRTIVLEPAVTIVHRSSFDADPARVLGHGKSGVVHYEMSDTRGRSGWPLKVRSAYDECVSVLQVAMAKSGGR